MRIDVLNPGGNDREEHFLDGAGAPDDTAHAPVNYHGFAACTGGGFYRRDAAIPAGQTAVLLLLRHDLSAARQALIELRRLGKTVAIAFKEAGMFQVAALLAKPAKLRLFQEICQRADGAIATTFDLVPFYRAAGVRAVEFIPTPYPVEDERWDFSQAQTGQRGIFVGTREFAVPSRNHLAALFALRMLAEPMQEPVTVCNVDGWRGRRLLERLGWPPRSLRVFEGRLPYSRYLQLLAQHKLVFQLDASGVPGQVAGDALLCRIPCLGGNGTTERLVFPDLCGYGRSNEQLFDLAARLIEHVHDRTTAVQTALELAAGRLSFARVAADLRRFFDSIHRGSSP